MNLKGFRNNYSGAPYNLLDFAVGASCVTDDKELMIAAHNYIAAKVAFEDALETNNVVVG